MNNSEHNPQVMALERTFFFFSTENTIVLNWVHHSEPDYKSIVKSIVTTFHVSSIKWPISLVPLSKATNITECNIGKIHYLCCLFMYFRYHWSFLMTFRKENFVVCMYIMNRWWLYSWSLFPSLKFGLISWLSGNWYFAPMPLNSYKISIGDHDFISLYVPKTETWLNSW